MSDTKPVEVPKETTPPTAEAVAATEVTPTPPVETSATAAAETTPAAASTEEAIAPAAETPAAETETAPAAEEAKKEVKPVEEGHLESKGTKFPSNFLYTKRFFWFGSDAVEPKSLASYIKSEKATETAHHVAAWASHTGRGLLFYTEKGTDKAAPHGAILLSEASDPTPDGPTKFHFTSKGHKHTFKAGSAAERDNWVSQLKLKIAEAKELATSVTESETYKSTIESFKPTPPASKKEEAKTDEIVASEATPATEEATKETTEAPAAEEATPAAESPKEEKKEEPKRRSASRKRASIFGSLLGKKEAEKKDEKKEEPAADAAAAAPAEATATETPAAEAAPESTAAPVATEASAAEVPAEEKKEETKPTPSKRTSIFGGFPHFGKKKAAEQSATGEVSSPTVPAKDTPTEVAPVSETAPVIPAVETTAPLSTDVSSPAAVATEATDATPATNGETKKEAKPDTKRKSSLPFGIGKKEKASTSDEETEKVKSPSAFSKFRATIKGKAKAPTDKAAEKPTEKAEDKTEEKPVEGEASKATEKTEAEKPAEAEASAPATEESPKPVAAAPVVAATA